LWQTRARYKRQADEYFQAQPSSPSLTAVERNDFFKALVEPSLQRELRHKGSAIGEGAYSAELIAFLEISTAKH